MTIDIDPETCFAADPAPDSLSPIQALDAFVGRLRDTAVSRDTIAWNRIHHLVRQLQSVISAVRE